MTLYEIKQSFLGKLLADTHDTHPWMVGMLHNHYTFVYDITQYNLSEQEEEELLTDCLSYFNNAAEDRYGLPNAAIKVQKYYDIINEKQCRILHCIAGLESEEELSIGLDERYERFIKFMQDRKQKYDAKRNNDGGK